MAGYRTGRRSWMDTDFYPVKERLINGAQTQDDAVFLVDIGGGKGHDLQELYQKHPDLPGTLVLQDLKGVIGEAKAAGLSKKITPMAHDFFTKQPIIGTLPTIPKTPPSTNNNPQAHAPTTSIPASTTGPTPPPTPS